MGGNSRGVVVYGSPVRVDCSVSVALRSVPFRSVPRETNGDGLAFLARSSRPLPPALDFAVSPRDQTPQDFIPALSAQGCFSPLSPCKNGHPETTRNPSATRLRFQISLSSIDRCPPFHAKRTDKAGDNLRPKTDRRFSRQSRPLARLVQDDGRRKLPQIIEMAVAALRLSRV